MIHTHATRWFGVLLAVGCASSAVDGPDASRIDAARVDGSPDVGDGSVADGALDGSFDDGSRDAEVDAERPLDPWAYGPPLGARLHRDGSLEVRVRAPNATRIEVALFSRALGENERLRVEALRDGDRFAVRIDAETLRAAGLHTGGSGEPLYYGLRVWGPNWAYDPAWTPGSELGFVVEIDAAGNRMNPNKVVLDPYALELSHDPRGPGNTDFAPFRGDAAHRTIDSALVAPKGIVIDVPPLATPGPGRALRDHVVYEVHLRGLTRADDTEDAGTYARARSRAASLAALGVTAIELLPLHETGNDQNELTPDASGDNYWGYSTLSYFAADRRYAFDRGPGGPTRELREMVRAFHDEGLEVWVDVVYNHTAEGTGAYFSMRGVDDATYYQHGADARTYVNHNGVGPNVATAQPIVADLVIDSLRYWHEVIGVDGYRFDLASILGNACTRTCFRYEPDGLLARITDELGRPRDGGRGAIMVAEPWGIGEGTYRLGQFPEGWAEWNDRFRDTVRRDLNRLGQEVVPLRDLARRIAGSPDVFGRFDPASSINFVTAHDGFTLRDLFAYDAKQNEQAWPWGPSSGGSDHNLSWSYDGDVVRQRRSARTAMALLALAHGVPMINGGDEHLRTQRGNNNPYNLDSPAIWLDPEGPTNERAFHAMTRALFAFRHAHAALRPDRFVANEDRDGDGRPALAWHRDDGARADDAYLDAPDRHFLSWVLDADELGDRDAAIWVAYNGWSSPLLANPPTPPEGTRWHLVVDTSEAGAAFDHARSDEDAVAVDAWPFVIDSRALAAFVAR